MGAFSLIVVINLLNRHHSMATFSTSQVAIITGASSGIGAGTAKRLAELGVGKFCLIGRNADALKETQKSCVEASKSDLKESDVLIVSGDVTDESVCKSIVDKTIESFGQIDILVNNAGIIKTGPFETSPLANFDELNNINVRCYKNWFSSTLKYLF